MRLEEALINLGDQPLSASPYSNAIKAFVNSLVADPSVAIDQNTPGHAVLSVVYQMTDLTKQDRILNKELGHVRSSDMYRNMILIATSFFGLMAIVLAILEVVNGDPVSENSTALLTAVFKGVFNVFIVMAGGSPVE